MDAGSLVAVLTLESSVGMAGGCLVPGGLVVGSFTGLKAGRSVESRGLDDLPLAMVKGLMEVSLTPAKEVDRLRVGGAEADRRTMPVAALVSGGGSSMDSSDLASVRSMVSDGLVDSKSERKAKASASEGVVVLVSVILEGDMMNEEIFMVFFGRKGRNFYGVFVFGGRE